MIGGVGGLTLFVGIGRGLILRLSRLGFGKRLEHVRDGLGKRGKERLFLWLLGFMALLFLDEYVKEGYLFRFEDVLKPVTHEFIILVLGLGLAVLGVYKALKRLRGG